ncbi:MAG: ABC transporter substrate-binding protein [Proteobacteria bacterium]|jgi:branched-chain amino acid transport system substrate-binding protein|nr:ABC transporter substrate-binding protein [Pseudomonadota bacterium]MBP10918.1 ABC transporter substrate-binding protein [Acidiferrobacteraceae bacterium]MDP6414800.1 ABC transporter substrate-binding protein [Gammaproteobacteria bacterium]HCF73325.1 ABC transporter substrate-binding protein [Gammaproteobacteria bacterium]|tara:strand:- start:1398 stop:2612 length:1215 start_codon:yes stop_codon:yes gene_type:complete
MNLEKPKALGGIRSLVASAALASFIATPAVAGEARIGVLNALTGPIPDLVAVMLQSEQAAAAFINANGGIWNGDKVALAVGDSACDAKAGVDAATKVVNVEQASIIVGPVCSGATIGATQAVTIPAGVVVISPSATSPAITDLDDNDTVFRVCPSDAYQGVTLAKLARSMGYSKVATTYANDDYNAGLHDVFVKAFQDAGGTITADQMHEANKASYRSELATLAQGEPEALVLFAYYNGSGITIMRQSLENGFFSKFLGGDGMVADQVIAEIGADNLADTVFTKGTSDEGSPHFKTYAGLFAKPSDPYVAQAWDTVMIAALALQRAGEATRDLSEHVRAVTNAPGVKVGPGDWAKAKKLLEEGKDIDYQGAGLGEADFDENGDVAGLYGKNEVIDGKWVETIVD